MSDSVRRPRPYVNPYLGGTLLGVVLFLSFFITGNGLGASAAVRQELQWQRAQLGMSPS